MSKLRVSASKRYDEDVLLINSKPIKETRVKTDGGHSRKIFFLEDVIIKVTTDVTKDWNQSATEMKIWKKLLPDDRKHFAEVVGGGKVRGRNWFWIAQRNLKFSIPWGYLKVPAVVQNTLQDLVDRYSLDDVPPDLCGRNWAVADGVPVIYDYGCLDDGFDRE